MPQNYIAVDWSQQNMAIALESKPSEQIKSFELDSNLDLLKKIIGELSGSVSLAFEECGQAQWLYTELKPLVEELVVCDPWRNHLLREGVKTDKADAEKLLKLLKAGLLKPIFHSYDELTYIRYFVEGYDNLVQAGVRFKNQRKALIAANAPSNDPHHQFVLERLTKRIALYEDEKKEFRNRFRQLALKNDTIKLLLTIPGIGFVGGVQLAARVVDITRFKSKGHFLSYCGLIKLDRISGGKLYGRKLPRHCRKLRKIFKTAAMAIINGPADSRMRAYYDSCLAKGYEDYNARHALARKIAIIAYAVLTNEEEFNVDRFGK